VVLDGGERGDELVLGCRTVVSMSLKEAIRAFVPQASSLTQKQIGSEAPSTTIPPPTDTIVSKKCRLYTYFMFIIQVIMFSF